MVLGVCDVHRLLDGDTAPREVEFCSFCQAWICKEDLHRYPRRIQAWHRKRAEMKLAER